MKLFVLNFDGFLILLRALIPLDIVYVLHVDILIGIDILLLVLSILLSLLSSNEILSFDVKWILSAKVNFE